MKKFVWNQPALNGLLEMAKTMDASGITLSGNIARTVCNELATLKEDFGKLPCIAKFLRIVKANPTDPCPCHICVAKNKWLSQN